MNQAGLTIGRLARAAGVGIETVRYYQRRKLLPVPVAQDSALIIQEVAWGNSVLHQSKKMPPQG